MQKKILLFIAFLVCTGLAIGVYMYRKPRTTAASQQTDFKLSADELYKQFETNETSANQKYVGKILEVTGTVNDVQKTDSTLSVLLTVTDGMGGINCSMATTEVAAVQQAKNITVKGKCAGFLMDVNVLDAVIIENK